jgi:hydroxypyruvate reductase
MLSLILSDVVGSSLDVIASGPTIPDNSTFQEAHDILERYKLTDKIPVNVLERIRQGVLGQQPETPKPGEAIFANVHDAIVGSNRVAAEAALEQAVNEGYNVMLLTTYLQGEARQAGRLLSAIARQVADSGQPLPRPACILAGGETTVTLHGDGLGGRNQELALGAVVELAGLQDIALVTLATDGGDGPTDAAGAVVTEQTLARAEQAGLIPDEFLARNDAYHFFQRLGDLLKPGPTLTNVNDLVFIFAH